MVVEEQQKREYRPFEEGIIRQSGGGDFEDYIALPSEEPIQAHITDVKIGKKFNKTKGEDEDRLYVYATLSEGEGKGQVYRGDMSPVINNGSKMSNLSKLLEKLYGEKRDGIKVVAGQPEIIGMPVRIELSEPWGEKKLQFINEFKKPLASQKRIEVKTTDSVAETAGADQEINLDEIPF